MGFWGWFVVILFALIVVGGIIDRLRGRRARSWWRTLADRAKPGRSRRSPAAGDNIEVRDDPRRGVVVRIKEPPFYGFGQQSPNGRYLVATQDAHMEGSPERRINGRYALLADGELQLTGELERPKDPAVADDGTFVVADWLAGDGLKGVLYAFDGSGNRLLAHRFEANLGRPAISADGRYAAVTTAYVDNPDGEQMALFDLGQGRLLWQRDAPFLSNNLEIHPEQGILGAELFEATSNRERVSLGFFALRMADGALLDPEGLENARLSQGPPDRMADRVIALRKHMQEGDDPAETARTIVGWADRFLERDALEGHGVSRKRKAAVLQAKGEALEQLGDREGALNAYRDALALDPEVGGRQRLNRLQGA